MQVCKNQLELGQVLCMENCKVHKQQVDGCPPFRQILSALQTPTYNLAKFLVPHIKSLN